MTVNIYPVVHDVTVEFPAPRGFSTPLNLTPTTHEGAVEHRTSASERTPGPGAILDLAPAPLDPVGRYVIKITDKSGGIITDLTSTNPGVDKWTCSELSWELNGMGGGRIGGPTIDAALAGLFDFRGRIIDDREIQVSRDDLGLLQILVPSPRAKPKDTQMQCPDVTYHLKKKFVGRNNPAPNLIVNPTFETDVLDWTGVSTVPTWEASPFHDAAGSMLLTSGTRGEVYAQQFIDVPPLPYATFVWFSAWAYLDSAVDRTMLPTSGRGLWTVWRVGGTVVWQQGVSPNWRNTGEWMNLTTKVFIPADQSQQLELRLYCPQGTIRWDDLYAHREERLNCVGSPGNIIACLVSHASDTGLNKVPMNITADISRGEGNVSLARRYKYSEAARILSAMGEMADVAGGCDWLLETPSTTTRTVFTMERTGYDVGANKVNLVWGDQISDFEFVPDPDRRADQIRVQGRGSGDEVTEAFVDDDQSDQGWEFIRRASIEGSPNPKDQAEGIAVLYREPTTLVLQVIRTADLDVAMAIRDGYLKPGRLVGVKIDHGWVHVDEDYKILKTTFVPEKETAQLQLIAASILEVV